MDIFAHAVAGACTGAVFGHPVLGAAIAAAPDAVLGWRRRSLPSAWYNFTHSFLFIGCCTLVGAQFDLGFLVYFCLMSHIFLDLPTHGEQWAPPILYPIPWRCSLGTEWEFFNESWWHGLLFTFIWSVTWLSLWYSGIGSPS